MIGTLTFEEHRTFARQDSRAEGRGHIEDFAAPGRDYYTLTFDSDANRARFMKVTACDGDQRETVEESWLSNIFNILNTKGVAVRAEFSNGSDIKPLWFDTEIDEEALRKMCSLLAEQPSN